MTKNQAIFISFLTVIFPLRGLCQETALFTVSDFDLSGQVQSCLVSTDYGKEEYNFNEDGFLTESVTRFNDADYDVTLYKYREGALLEKRVEQYRDNLLDPFTSIANFFTIDTAQYRKVTEKIITYNKEFLEQNEYFYTVDERLSKIIRTNNDGIDETSVIYYQDDATDTADYFSNSELQQSIQTKIEILSDTIPIKTVTTKKFFEGKPSTAIEKAFAGDGKIRSETQFSYDIDLEKYVPITAVSHTYGPKGVLEKTVTEKGFDVETKEYLYQFDTYGNWVKQIITPDNTYKTRKIEYYETKKSIIEEE